MAPPAMREEWDSLPYAVPRIEPREGHVYVTSESHDSIAVGSEAYCRIYVSEGVVPKQVSRATYDAAQEKKKDDERESRDVRKLYGETAALGVRLRTVRTKSNGDCFFDAVCKAFGAGDARRCELMWRAAFGERSMPPRDVPPSMEELRGVVAAAFTEAQWLTAQAIGGEAFCFIVDDSLDATRANIAASAADAVTGADGRTAWPRAWRCSAASAPSRAC
eukprot:2415496-Prymnesium_polylepis.1